MPVVFAELASRYRPSKVSDPTSPIAAANGQYILISREAYDAVGGHAAIATSLLEDVELARVVKGSGRAIRFRLGKGMVRTRMYRSFRQLQEGWTKNLALLFPSPVRLAALRLCEFVLIACSCAMTIVEAHDGHLQAALALLCLFVTLYATFMVRVLKAHFSFDANVLALLGLPLFAYLLLRSWLFHKKGAVTWKDRTYRARAPSVDRAGAGRVEGASRVQFGNN